MTEKEKIAEADKFLNRARETRREIQKLRRHEERTSSLLHSVSYDRAHVRGSGLSDPTGDKVERLTEIRNRIEELQFEETVQRCEIVTIIHSLDNALEIRVLYSTYIQGRTLKQTAEEAGYNYNYLCHVKRDGLLNVYEFLCEGRLLDVCEA